MAERPAFQQTQLAFTAHIREPAQYAVPADVEDRRMAIYRELFFNNVIGFLESGFPVLRSLYDDQRWLALARKFFAHHRSGSPYFAEISREFLTFLQSEYSPLASDPPFLQELAHYEWVELALSIDEAEISMEDINPNGDLLSDSPAVSPLVWNLSYRWPVHRVSADFQPDSMLEQPTHLLVYRDREDEMGFIEANPVTARLMQLLQDEPGRSGRDYLLQIATELQHPQPDLVIDGGVQIMLKWLSRDVLLGTRDA